MRSTTFRVLPAVSFAFLAIIQTSERAQAIPIFAQRYRLSCEACHSVLPELNAFGRSFRAHGYRLPIPEHGTTVAALRYQVQFLNDPPAGTRRFAPGGIVLGNENFGAISAFVHYSLGAGGGREDFSWRFCRRTTSIQKRNTEVVFSNFRSRNHRESGSTICSGTVITACTSA